MTRRLATLLIVLLLTPLLIAAGPTNPTTLKFTVPADWSTTNVTGARLLVFTSIDGSGTPTRTVDLGKPTPDAAGLVTLTKDQANALLPINNAAGLIAGDYSLVIETYGPGGTTRSAPAIPFDSAGKPGAVTNVTLQ